ncbi:tyrosine-type recombinase/integrase [Streptomyces tanashiensis]
MRRKGSSGEHAPKCAPLKHRKEGGWRDIPAPASPEPFIDRLPIRNASGGPPYPDPLRKSWDRAIRRLEPPAYSPHELRHKWTTVALTNGVSVHEVSRRLGHRSIKVTVDRYGHLTQDGQERCRQVVGTTVGPHMLTAGRAPAARGAGSGPARWASRRSRRRPYRF